MRITYAGLSDQGPIRGNNEDYLGYIAPADPDDPSHKGYCVLIADGVGGHGDGEVASQLACETARKIFEEVPASVSAAQTIRKLFDAANLAVYDEGMARQSGERRMATTFTVCVLRNNELTVGHVGDTRVYILQGGRFFRLTGDHSYAGVQVKLGLITVDEIKDSPLRSVLTRTLGRDPAVRVDSRSMEVRPGDMIVMCTDGLHAYVADMEIGDTIRRFPPEEACRELISLAIRRGTDDNISVQVVRVDTVERVSYYRGVPVYQKVKDQDVGSDIEVGQILDDRFEITDVISRSGMATIYKANDRETGGLVALKVPFMQFESDPAFFTRFQREEQIGLRLRHPYILRIVPIPDEKKSRMYMAMEYLEGQTLGSLMRSVKPLPVADSLKIIARVCEAMEFMHGHDVVHRDLKPDNLMICSDGSIRIMDFGIAKIEGQRRLTFGGFQPAMGTPDYMAPEQVRGKRGDPRTDIYSLGAILYEMVTGQTPFEGPNAFAVMNTRLTGDPQSPRKLNAEIPPVVEEIILHAMARDPGDRYPNAKAMREELSSPESVQVTGRVDRLQKPAPLQTGWFKNRMVVWSVTGTILAITAFWFFSHFRIASR